MALLYGRAGRLTAQKRRFLARAGGAFKYFSGISGNYYGVSSRMAALTGMGVLNVDYRTTDAVPRPVSFPEDLADVLQAMQWLKAKGATELYVYGDSSGGTQVILTISHPHYPHYPHILTISHPRHPHYLTALTRAAGRRSSSCCSGSSTSGPPARTRGLR